MKIFSDIEYAIREKNIKDINKILKNNPEEITKVKIHTFVDIIYFNEFDFFDNILKSINNKFKKYILSNDEIIKQLLNSNNLEFINKYIKYIYLDTSYDIKYIIDLCIYNNNLELVDIIYKICKTLPNYSLLGHIFFEYFDNKFKINFKLINYLIKINKNMVNEKYNDIPIIAYAIINNNLELLKILKQADINFYYDDFNIFNYYINNENINNDILLYLLNNNININICNKELWTPGHYIFFKAELYTLEIKKIILKKTQNLNNQNTLGNTILHYLVLNDDINNYKDILIKKELDIFIKNKALYTPLTITITKKTNVILMDIVVESFINQIKNLTTKYTKEEATKYILENKTSIYKKTNNHILDKQVYNDDIIISDYNYVNHNNFNPNFINIQLFFIVMLERNNNLGVPYLLNNKIKIKDKEYQDEYFNCFIDNSKKYLYYKEEFMYLKIFWDDENNYMMTPNIGKAIEYTFKFKKYVFVFIHLFNQYLSHANILIFDRDKKLIIHFEPHGKLYTYVGKLYETMQNIFKKELKGFKYIPPLEYLPITAFQSMYYGQDKYTKKSGDLDGYCGAWCFWFVELYINNNKYDLKTLINKTIKKLINTKYTFLDHIRNYANNLNEKNVELLSSYGIKYNKINNQSFTDDINDIILNKISYDIQKLNY